MKPQWIIRARVPLAVVVGLLTVRHWSAELPSLASFLLDVSGIVIAYLAIEAAIARLQRPRSGDRR